MTGAQAEPSINSTADKGLYFVAVKLFLIDGGRLLITHDIFGDWDLPGGRIKKDEFSVPLEDIAARKIREELGEAVAFKLGEPKAFFRVARREARTGEQVQIFAVGFEADYKSGEIELGEHHDKFEWVDLDTFQPKEYFKGGWLQGVEAYMQRRRHGSGTTETTN